MTVLVMVMFTITWSSGEWYNKVFISLCTGSVLVMNFFRHPHGNKYTEYKYKITTYFICIFVFYVMNEINCVDSYIFFLIYNVVQ
jgi:hypothetical protein